MSESASVADDLDLSGRIALVTGAGRGIGRGIALRLAQQGADVAVNDLDASTSARTAEEVRALGRRSTPIPGDVSRSAEVDRIVDDAETALGALDVLVNNAGISLYRPIVDCTEEDWDQHLDIMAKGTFLLMRRVAPGMMARGWGRIVNLGSYVAQLNCVTKFFGPYCAAKFAIVGLTQVAAQEFAPAVTVNAVGPGDVATDMMAREWDLEGQRRDIPPDAVKEEYRRRLLLQRFEEPADIAGVVLFLCSSLADQITGSHLIVGGGLPFRAA
jgi:meso-butanediol dehydrogenase/(S,S)-butanediol dehydrogenase/diacetyl reductase